MMKNIFNEQDVRNIIARIEQLTPDTAAQWGKMNAAQMLAHCNVAYEMTYDNIHPKPNAIMRFLLTSFVKKGVVNEQPYKKNSPTAPAFLIKAEKDFEQEKTRLVDYLQKTLTLGAAHFEGKENLSFGKMSTQEWNNLFAKHLDHHLTQFGV